MTLSEIEEAIEATVLPPVPVKKRKSQIRNNISYSKIPSDAFEPPPLPERETEVDNSLEEQIKAINLKEDEDKQSLHSSQRIYRPTRVSLSVKSLRSSAEYRSTRQTLIQSNSSKRPSRQTRASRSSRRVSRQTRISKNSSNKLTSVTSSGRSIRKRPIGSRVSLKTVELKEAAVAASSMDELKVKPQEVAEVAPKAELKKDDESLAKLDDQFGSMEILEDPEDETAFAISEPEKERRRTKNQNRHLANLGSFGAPNPISRTRGLHKRKRNKHKGF